MGPALCWAHLKDSTLFQGWNGSLSKSCWRCDPCSHHSVPSQPHIPCPQTPPTLTRPVCSCSHFFLTHIRLSSDLVLPHFPPQHALGDVLPTFSSLLQPCFPSAGRMDLSREVKDSVDVSISMGCDVTPGAGVGPEAVCGHSRTGTGQIFFSMSCEIPFVWPTEFYPPRGH